MSHVDASPSSKRATSATEQPGGWVNVGGRERAATAVLGGLLLAWGLRERYMAGSLAALGGAALLARSATGHCPGYAALKENEQQARIAREHHWSSAATAHERITVARPRDEVYRFWRNVNNLPSFMQNVHAIEKLSDDRSRWTVRGPAGRLLHWDAHITDDRPHEFISWDTEEGADVRNTGWVRFKDADGGRATEIETFIAYEPPAGTVGRLVATLAGYDPSSATRRNLLRLKQILESSEPHGSKGPNID